MATNASSNSNGHGGKLHVFARDVILVGTGFAGCAAAFLAWAILIAGLFEIVFGLVQFFALFFQQLSVGQLSDVARSPRKIAIVTVLGGVEYLLLSPLPYILIRSVSTWITDLKRDGAISPKTKADIVEAKAQFVALLIGILMVGFIADTIGEGITITTAAPPLSGLVVFIAYFFGLEILHKHCKPPHTS